MCSNRSVIVALVSVLVVVTGCGSSAPTPSPIADVSSQSPAQAPVLAELAVLADPDGAEVVVDGELMGRSPVTLTLPVGAHEIALRAAGYLPLTETLTLRPGQEGIYSPVLDPEIAPTTAPIATATAEPTSEPTAISVQPTVTSTSAAPAAAATFTPPPTEAPAPVEPAATPTPMALTRLHIIEVALPTYPYAPFVRSAVDPTLDNYPLLTLDRAAYEATAPVTAPVTHTLIVLENKYLRLSILPDLGGRVYECVFKPTGHNEFYRNPVVKPTGWGPPSPPYPPGANWWLGIGGLEWGFPVEEHGYEWSSRWGHDHVALPDGGVMVSVFTRDPRRPYVVVDIVLPPDAAYFTVRPKIVNPWGGPFRFKWWANAMLAPGPANAPGPDLHFIFPVSEMTVHSTGDPSLPGPGQPLSWPIYAGRDLSRLGNWQGYLGFFESPAAQGDFMGVYDTAVDEGMLRVYPSAIARGAKGFAAGLSGGLDPANWTDDGSGYVELHGGLTPTFSDWYGLEAGEAIFWIETWYPVAGIGGVTHATAGGALFLAGTGDGLRVNFFPTRAVRGLLTVTLPGLAPLVREVAISPAEPLREAVGYTDAVPAVGEVSVTLTDAGGATVLAYRGQVALR